VELRDDVGERIPYEVDGTSVGVPVETGSDARISAAVVDGAAADVEAAGG